MQFSRFSLDFHPAFLLFQDTDAESFFLFWLFCQFLVFIDFFGFWSGGPFWT